MRASLTSALNESSLQVIPLEHAYAPRSYQDALHSSFSGSSIERQNRFGQLLDFVASNYGMSSIERENIRGLMDLISKVQQQKRSLQEQLSTLSTMHPSLKGHAAKIDGIHDVLSKLTSVEQAFEKALYKEGGRHLGGYIQRFWSNESWREWFSSRSELGKFILWLSDYAQSTLSEPAVLQRLQERNIDLVTVGQQAQSGLAALKCKIESLGVELDADSNTLIDRRLIASFGNLDESLNGRAEVVGFLEGLTFPNNGYKNAIRKSDDGGYVLVGRTIGQYVDSDCENNCVDIWVTRLDAAGGVVWSEAIGTSAYDEGMDVEVLSDGTYAWVGTGKRDNTHCEKILVAQLNATGSVLWGQLIGDDYCNHGYAVTAVADGGFVVTGGFDPSSGSYGFGSFDVLVARFNHTGEMVSMQAFGSAHPEYGKSIDATSDGGFVVAGWVNTAASSGGWKNLFVVKFAANGDILWSRYIGTYGDDSEPLVKATEDGGLILTGYTTGYASGDRDALLVRIDQDGQMLWAKVIGTAEDDQGKYVAETSDGNILFAGYTYNATTGYHDAIIAKFNASGALLWSRGLGGILNGYYYSFDYSEDRGVVVTGYDADNGHSFVGQLDENGQIKNCSSIYDMHLNTTDIPSFTFFKDAYSQTKDVIDLLPHTLIDLNQTNITSLVTASKVCSESTQMEVATTAQPTTISMDTTITGFMNVADSFFKVWGGGDHDYAHAITPTADGNFLITGWSQSFYRTVGVFVAKMDPSGNFIWSKVLDDLNYGYYTQETSAGDFISVGYTGNVPSRIHVNKLNSTGGIVWSETLYNSYNLLTWGHFIHCTPDGGSILWGTMFDYDAPHNNILLVKLDEHGSIMWSKILNSMGVGCAESGEVDDEGNFILSGCSSSSSLGGNERALIAKFNQTGSMLWARCLGEGGDRAYSVKEAQDGGYIVTGYTVNYGMGNKDILLARIDENLGLKWAMTMGGSDDDEGRSVHEASNGDIVIAGNTASYGLGSTNLIVARFNALGNLLWASLIDGPTNTSSQQTETGGILLDDESILLTGYTTNYGMIGKDDALVAKLNADGLAADCSYVYRISPELSNITSVISYIGSAGFTAEDISTSFTVSSMSKYEQDVTDYLLEYEVCEDGDEVVSTTPPTQNTLDITQNGSLVDITNTFLNFWGGSGYENAQFVTPTSDGQFVLIGRTVSSYDLGNSDSDNYDVLVAKLDTSGNVSWATVYGKSSSDTGYFIHETDEGEFLITGTFSSTMFISKLNATGDVLWTYQSIHAGWADYIDSTADGGFIFWGGIENYCRNLAGSRDCRIMAKVNPDWSVAWAKVMNDQDQSYQCYAGGIQLSDGDYIMLGCSSVYSSNSRYGLILRFNSAGTIIWTRILRTTSEIHAIRETKNGDLILTGYISGYGAEGLNILVARLNRVGGLLWMKNFGGDKDDQGRSIDEAPNGDLVVVGNTESFGSDSNNVIVARFDSTGELLWSKILDDPEGSIIPPQTTDSGLTLLGDNIFIVSYGISYDDILVSKLNASGSIKDCSYVYNVSPEITVLYPDYEYTLDYNVEIQWEDMGISFYPYLYTKSMDVTNEFIRTSVCPAKDLYDTTTNAPLKNTTKVFKKPNSTVAQLSSMTARGITGVVTTEHSLKDFTTEAISTTARAVTTEGAYYPTYLKSFGSSSKVYGESIVQTADGGAIVAGYCTGFGSGFERPLIFKLGKNSQMIWAKVLGPKSSFSGHAHSIIQADDDSFVVVGVIGSEVLVIKVNTTGNVVWSQKVGQTTGEGCSLQKTWDNGFIIAGMTHEPAGLDNVLVSRLDAFGHIVWAKAMGATDMDYSQSIQVNAEHEFLLSGWSAENYLAENHEVLAVKLNATGDLLWAKNLKLSGPSTSYDIQATSDGGCVLVGCVGTFGYGFVARLNATGDMVWANKISDVLSIFYSMDQTQDGGFVLAGMSQDYDWPGLVIKIDAMGSFVWGRKLGGLSGNVYLYSIKESRDGGFLLTGVGAHASGDRDVEIAHLNATGWIENCSDIEAVYPEFVDVSDQVEVNTAFSNSTDITDRFSVSSTSLDVQDVTEDLVERTACPYTDSTESTTMESVATTFPVPSSTSLEQTIQPVEPSVNTTRPVQTSAHKIPSTLSGTSRAHGVSTDQDMTEKTTSRGVLSTSGVRPSVLSTFPAQTTRQDISASDGDTSSTLPTYIPTTLPGASETDQQTAFLNMVIGSVVGGVVVLGGIAGFIFWRCKQGKSSQNYSVNPGRRASVVAGASRRSASGDFESGEIFSSEEGAASEHALIHMVATQDKRDVVALLQEGGVDLEATTPRKRTALSIAASVGKVDMVKVLLAHKADMATKDKGQLTPLHVAAKEGRDEVVMLLLASKADMNGGDKLGYTPLHWACEKGHLAITDLLLGHDADLTATNHRKRTPLHVASEEGRDKVVHALLLHKANIAATDRYRYTALHLSSREGRLDVVRALVAWKADLEACCKDGNTPLLFAAQRKHDSVVAFLTSMGSDLIARNNQDMAAFDLAEGDRRVLGALAGPRLLRVWKGKDTPPREEPIFEPVGVKKGGCCVGYRARNKKGQDYIAKFSLADKDLKSEQYKAFSRLTDRRKVHYLSFLTVIKEKIAADVYSILGQGRFYVAKHRLAMLNMINSYIRDIAAVEDFLKDINKGRSSLVRTMKGLCLLSKVVKGYHNLSELEACWHEEVQGDPKPFRAFLEDGLVPDFVKIEGQVVPLLGLGSILAAARLMGDNDVLGGLADNTGYVVERGDEGVPIAVRAVKIDPGESFGFKKHYNQLYQAVQDFARGHREYNQNRLSDRRDIQFGNNHPVSILWSKLSTRVKKDFVSTLSRGLSLLKRSNVLNVLIEREGVFDEAIYGPEKIITDRVCDELIANWEECLAMQADIYQEPLSSLEVQVDEDGSIPFDPKACKAADYNESDLNDLLATSLSGK